MTVQELIQKKGTGVHTIHETATVAEAAKLLLANDVGSVVICRGEDAIGIFTKNDLLRRYVESPADFERQPVRPSSMRPLFSTTPDANLSDVFSAMVDRGIRHVPVIDGSKVIGMVTPIDILLYLKEAIRHENEHLVRYIQGTY